MLGDRLRPDCRKRRRPPSCPPRKKVPSTSPELSLPAVVGGKTIVGISGSVVNGIPLIGPRGRIRPVFAPSHDADFEADRPIGASPRRAGRRPLAGPGTRDARLRPKLLRSRGQERRRSPGPVVARQRRRTRRPRRRHLGGEPQVPEDPYRSPHPPRAAPATGVVPRSADTPARRRQTGVASGTPTAAPREGPPAPGSRNPSHDSAAASPRHHLGSPKTPRWSGTVERA